MNTNPWQMIFSLAVLLPGVAWAQVRMDHATVAGSSLEAMTARLARAGLAAEPGGPHSNRATEMALVSFPDGSYLELIARQKQADPAAVASHPWAALLATPGVPAAWAIRPKDFDAEVKRLRDSGVAVEVGPRTGRQRPDGVSLEWQTAQPSAGDQARLLPFLIQDFTPRERRAEPSGHPTTKDFGGIRYVVVAVNNLKDAIAIYHTAFGVPPPIKQIDAELGAQLALLGGLPVILAAPLTPASPLRDHLQKFGEGPFAFILSGRNTKKYHAAAKSRWFGADVSWLDPEQLGWRLGFE